MRARVVFEGLTPRGSIVEASSAREAIMAATTRRFGPRAVWVRDTSTGRYGTDWESEYGSIYKRPAMASRWSGLVLWSDRVRAEVQWLDGAPAESDCHLFDEAYRYLEARDFRL